MNSLQLVPDFQRSDDRAHYNFSTYIAAHAALGVFVVDLQKLLFVVPKLYIS